MDNVREKKTKQNRPFSFTKQISKFQKYIITQILQCIKFKFSAKTKFFITESSLILKMQFTTGLSHQTRKKHFIKFKIHMCLSKLGIKDVLNLLKGLFCHDTQRKISKAFSLKLRNKNKQICYHHLYATIYRKYL